MTVALDLDLQVATEEPECPDEADLARWAEAALEGRRERAALTVRLVGEEESRELNLAYRGLDKPTNVLSFPFELPPGIDREDPVAALLGDLAICAPLVHREALEQGKERPAHWAHLVVHGVLHLLDYDHRTDQEAAEMEALETVILAALGFPPPYEESTEEAYDQRST
jgi:probable rRNA maturation factor